MSIFQNDLLDFQLLDGSLLLVNGTDFLQTTLVGAVRDQRQFPDDGNRNFPTPIDLQRDWPDV